MYRTWLASIAWTLLAASLPGLAAGEAGRPNVLFIICDDLNCNLGCYGHRLVETPHIDRLADRGLRFDRAYCQFPLCGPSRASLMTGLYPDQTRVRRNAIYVRQHLPDVVTLPQYFRQHGYFAARVGKIFHYSVPAHIGTGGHDDPYSWDQTINPRGRDKEDEPEIFTLRPGKFGGTMSWLAADGEATEQTDGVGATEAIRLLERFAEQDQPFFLAVGLYRPHTPYVAPRRYFDLYPLDAIERPSVSSNYLETLPEPARITLTRKREQVNLPDELAIRAIQAYYASISFADAQVGRILAALDRVGLRNETIVLFTSDHGYHMGEHGHWQKTTLFEDATRVPLIVAGPGVAATGHSTQSLAELIDIFPTMAELCQLPPPSPVSGDSLAAIMQDPIEKVRASVLTQFASGYSLRTQRYRYTEWGAEGRDGAELYDHTRDPAELINLATDREQAGLVARLSAQLRKRMESAGRVPAGVSSAPRGR